MNTEFYSCCCLSLILEIAYLVVNHLHKCNTTSLSNLEIKINMCCNIECIYMHSQTIA